MLNLTAFPITLITEDDDAKTIEPSGYVARVETERRKVQMVMPPGQHVAKALGIPIIEQTPTEIVVTVSAHDKDEVMELCWLILGNGPGDEFCSLNTLLLVTREVAEAAAYLEHPLAARMAWADEDSFVDATLVELDERGRSHPSPLIGYRALQRFPTLTTQLPERT